MWVGAPRACAHTCFFAVVIALIFVLSACSGADRAAGGDDSRSDSKETTEDDDAGEDGAEDDDDTDGRTDGEPGDDDDSAPPPDDDSTGNSDDDSDDDAEDDDSGDVDDDGGDNVIDVEDLGASWDCVRADQCIEDYQSFIRMAEEYASPISEEDLKEEFWAVGSEEIPDITEPIAAPILRERLIEILNVDFLFQGMNERKLTATTISLTERENYVEREILFTDPWVGTFKGILLVPSGSGPFPAVLAIHGHGDVAEIFRDDYFGAEYPERGYVILMLTMRANGADDYEDGVSRALLLSGLTLMGLRHYEALLGWRYLRHLPEVIDERIGLVGHSGGSVNNNVLVRMGGEFAAAVSDCAGTYLGNWDDRILDEAVPLLHPYHLLINDIATSEIPILRQNYGYPDGSEPTFAFFDEWLRP